MLKDDEVTYESTLLFDYDGTVMLTFAPSPNGVGVKEAYEAAIEGNFGGEALTHYLQTGGLNNRSPREVVVALQEAGYQRGANTSELTDAVVELKIECLLGEVGKRLHDGKMWPVLTPGFKPFWKTLKASESMYTGVLSSGHRAFIEKAFAVHELELPNLLVTDDELRALPTPLSKPDPRLMDVVVKLAGFDPPLPVYIGDDENKDGKFAANCHMPFFHLVPFGSPLLTERDNTFADWVTFGGRFARFGGM